MSCDGDRRDLWGALARLSRRDAPRLLKPVVSKATKKIVEKLVEDALRGGSGKKRRNRKKPRGTPGYATSASTRPRTATEATRSRSRPSADTLPEIIYCEVKWAATNRKRDWTSAERGAYAEKYQALMHFLHSDPELGADVDPAHGAAGPDGRRLPKVSSLVAYAAVHDWLRESPMRSNFMAEDDEGPLQAS